MAYYSRFSPFLNPYLPQMVGAAVLVMAVALVNLLLVRLAGFLWDIITVQHDLRNMTNAIGLFLGLVIAQGKRAMGHSYLPPWVSQHILAAFPINLCVRVS